MGLGDLLRRLDRRVGIGQRYGESRRDFLVRCSRFPGYVPRELYVELIALHDRVAALEAELAELRARTARP